MKKIDDFVAMVPTMTAQAAETDQPTMEVVKKDGRTVVTSQSKIVKGRAERVIGAGHFVVYPNENESADVVKTGNQVMVLTDMKLFLDITLRDSPMSSCSRYLCWTEGHSPIRSQRSSVAFAIALAQPVKTRSVAQESDGL